MEGYSRKLVQVVNLKKWMYSVVIKVIITPI